MAKKGPDLPPDDAGRVATVTEFTRRVKELLEGGLPPCWVQGEVSNLRAQASGHVYFSLKDAGAQLSCVLFRGDAARQSLALRDGLAVLAYGEVSVYEARGQYQLVVRALIDHGAGRLQAELEKLKSRLAAEGLFDPARKQPIPLLPRTVGFITSPTGAAVQDFIRILTRRGWTGRLVVLPAKVQGEGAAAELAAMLRTAEALKIFDLLVIGRGGGSIEDLWAFNEEPLVRAVADCGVPIISAVGHEIDTTLCDYAADVRAETPSGAAELISSHYVAATERLQQAAAGLVDSLAGAVAQAAERLDHARSRLRLLAPTGVIEHNHLRLAARHRAGAARHGFAGKTRAARVAPAAGVVETPRVRQPGVGAQARLRHRARRVGPAGRARQGHQARPGAGERVPRRQVARAGGIKGRAAALIPASLSVAKT